MPQSPTVFVHLLPSLIPASALSGGVALVIDVLRATTAMTHALASGVECIIPCFKVNEARAIAASLPGGTALLGGERQGLPIEGFDLGNSPSSYTVDVCRGKTLVMTTTNGTRAIEATRDADRVFIAAFSNAQAAARAAVGAAEGRAIHLICAGTDGRISLEDTLLAGMLRSLVAGEAPSGNDEAEIAMAAASSKGAGGVRAILGRGRGGRRVTDIGLAPDIDDAAAIDRFDFAAELLRDRSPHRIVRI